MTEEKRKDRLRSSFKSIFGKLLFRRENVKYIVFRIVLLCSAAALIIGDWYFFERRQNYWVGAPAEKTYLAITEERYVDKEATENLRRRAADRVAAVMVQDEKIAAEVNRRLEEIEAGHLDKLFNQPLLDIYEEQSDHSKRRVIANVLAIGREVCNEADNRDVQTSLIWKALKETPLPQSERNIVFQMLDIILSPSLQPDADLVEKVRDDVSSEFPSVVKELKPGSVIVQKGQIVTPALAEILHSQGYPDAAFPWRQLIFVLCMIVLWSFWPLWIADGLREDEKPTEKDWLYIAVVLAVTWTCETLLFRITGKYSMAVIGLTGWLCLTMPVSLSFHVILGGGVLSYLIAFNANPSILCLGCFVSAASACLGRILFIDLPDNRMTIWKKVFALGLSLGVISTLVFYGLGLIVDVLPMVFTLAFSMFWGILVIALLPLWESLFDVLSPQRLLELCDQSQKLIKDMRMQAPGTYSHVDMVGTLAAAAADELRMNSLLVRAGAYCHDIGKLSNPQCFVENQRKGQNVHDSLPPHVSVRIIMSHVTAGLELAEEYGIPSRLRRFISEHHGTTLQKYFYEKAKALGEDVSEKDFRYPGPRPQSRETALVMLADSVEAAVKARTKPFETEEELKKYISDVIKSKRNDGQLDDVDFTRKDFIRINEAFAAALKASWHSREVKNIKEIMAEAEKAKDNDNAKENAG